MSLKFLYVNDDGYYEEGYVEGIFGTRDCDSSLSVGDLVTESLSITNGVDKVIDNNSTRSVIGWVFDKPTSITATILYKGVITGLSGLEQAGKVFLSDTGSFTSTKPLSGYLHLLGHAFAADQIEFNPVNTKIKLI